MTDFSGFSLGKIRGAPNPVASAALALTSSSFAFDQNPCVFLNKSYSVVILSRDMASKSDIFLDLSHIQGVFIHTDDSAVYQSSVKNAIDAIFDKLSEEQRKAILSKAVGFTVNGVEAFRIQLLQLLKTIAESDNKNRQDFSHFALAIEKLPTVWQHLKFGYLVSPLLLQHGRLQILTNNAEKVREQMGNDCLKDLKIFFARDDNGAFTDRIARDLFLHPGIKQSSLALAETLALCESATDCMKPANVSIIEPFLNAAQRFVEDYTPNH